MKFSDLHLEQEASGFIIVTAKLIDAYAEISWDYNPIHMDNAAAMKVGFTG